MTSQYLPESESTPARSNQSADEREREEEREATLVRWNTKAKVQRATLAASEAVSAFESRPCVAKTNFLSASPWAKCLLTTLFISAHG